MSSEDTSALGTGEVSVRTWVEAPDLTSLAGVAARLTAKDRKSVV